MRLVLDTNVILASVLSDAGASRQLLQYALSRQIVTLCSVPLMPEYESVLKRQHHLESAGITVEDVDTLLDALAAVIEPVRFSFLWRPMLKDAKDEMVLATAVNGQADAPITRDLTELAPNLAGFGIRAMAPGPAVRWIRSMQ